MKRRYKLILIILIGTILTILINNIKVSSKTNFTAIGDGLSIGMTPYNVAGTSFNDYLKERLDVDNYNTEFSYEHQTIHELNESLFLNKIGTFSKKPIKQTLAKSSLITIAIGIDEFAEKSLVQDIDTILIDTYLKEINELLQSIRTFYKKDIILIGLYPAYNFSKSDAIEVNSKLKIICGKYNASFIDILAISLNSKYYLEPSNYYLNYLAHKEIAKLIYVMLS